MLTWGRMDDGSLFEDGDLSVALVLFRLPIRWFELGFGDDQPVGEKIN